MTDQAVASKYEKDIKSLNRKFLLLVREMEREDSFYAHTVTGVPKPIRNLLSEMTLEQIDEMVEGLPVMPFHFRLPERHWKRIAQAMEGAVRTDAVRLLTIVHALQSGNDANVDSAIV